MKPLIIILGPTASGKTHLATKLADRLNGEIISADSRQVYRRMDIGTGKDLNEYLVNGKAIRHHLIDIIDAGEKYNVNEFQQDFKAAYEDIESKGKVPVVCGGTGFYIYSVLKGHALASIPVDEELRHELATENTESLHIRFKSLNTIYRSLADTSTRKRIIRAIEISKFLLSNPEIDQKLFAQSAEYEYVIYGLNPPVDVRRARISARLKYRLENGLIEEVESLLKNGISADQLIYYGLEYKYVTMFLTNQLNYIDMTTKLESEIHRFAKRQMTFFRKIEKDGFRINWLDFDKSNDEQADLIVSEYTNLKTT